jgi:hypothetical protein
MPKRGIVGFNANEISILLDAAEEYLPIGQNDWEMVERMHGRYYPQAGRTKESLKCKFIQLYGTRIPTGDPKCPDDVKRAKYPFEEIKKRSELSNGGGDNTNIPDTSLDVISPMLWWNIERALISSDVYIHESSDSTDY